MLRNTRTTTTDCSLCASAFEELCSVASQDPACTNNLQYASAWLQAGNNTRVCYPSSCSGGIVIENYGDSGLGIVTSSSARRRRLLETPPAPPVAATHEPAGCNVPLNNFSASCTLRVSAASDSEAAYAPQEPGQLGGLYPDQLQGFYNVHTRWGWAASVQSPRKIAIVGAYSNRLTAIEALLLEQGA